MPWRVRTASGVVVNSDSDKNDNNDYHTIIIELLCHPYISIRGIKESLGGYTEVIKVLQGGY